MTKKSPEDRLMELEDKKTRIEARLKLEREAIRGAKRREHAKILNRRRKDDTRRKILLGAAMMKKIDDGDWQQARMRALMDGFLDKDLDRELFQLKPRN